MMEDGALGLAPEARQRRAHRPTTAEELGGLGGLGWGGSLRMIVDLKHTVNFYSRVLYCTLHRTCTRFGCCRRDSRLTSFERTRSSVPAAMSLTATRVPKNIALGARRGTGMRSKNGCRRRERSSTRWQTTLPKTCTGIKFRTRNNHKRHFGFLLSSCLRQLSPQFIPGYL